MTKNFNMKNYTIFVLQLLHQFYQKMKNFNMKNFTIFVLQLLHQFYQKNLLETSLLENKASLLENKKRNEKHNFLKDPLLKVLKYLKEPLLKVLKYLKELLLTVLKYLKELFLKYPSLVSSLVSNQQAMSLIVMALLFMIPQYLVRIIIENSSIWLVKFMNWLVNFMNELRICLVNLMNAFRKFFILHWLFNLFHEILKDRFSWLNALYLSILTCIIKLYIIRLLLGLDPINYYIIMPLVIIKFFEIDEEARRIFREWFDKRFGKLKPLLMVIMLFIVTLLLGFEISKYLTNDITINMPIQYSTLYESKKKALSFYRNEALENLIQKNVQKSKQAMRQKIIKNYQYKHFRHSQNSALYYPPLAQ